jgi:hypothetical protein
VHLTRSAIQVLQYATVLSHAGIVLSTCFHTKSLTAFLRKVVEYLGIPGKAICFDAAQITLLQALLVTMTAIELDAHKSDEVNNYRKLWAGEDIWSLVVNSDTTDISTSCEL